MIRVNSFSQILPKIQQKTKPKILKSLFSIVFFFLKVSNPAPKSQLQKIIITPDVADVRPIVMGAVLRNVTFTEASYESFIDLQDKLHQNLARRRTLGQGFFSLICET